VVDALISLPPSQLSGPHLSTEASSLLSGTAHHLHPLADHLVHLEELCAASVDTDGLAFQEITLGISVGRRVWLNALGVA